MVNTNEIATSSMHGALGSGEDTFEHRDTMPGKWFSIWFVASRCTRIRVTERSVQ
jgi:hypothetical protein